MADTRGGHNHVKVVVRTRPTARFAKEMINIDEDLKTIYIKSDPAASQDFMINTKKHPEWNFSFDNVFYQSSQESVYSAGVAPYVSRAFDGYTSCIMAYGQVGSGKSYTMVGPEDDFVMRGVIPRAIGQVFQEIERREEESASIIKVSYIEVYNDRIVDLLAELPKEKQNSPTLAFSESSTEVVSLTGPSLKVVESEEEALNLFFEGEFHRTVSYHPLNMLSSRSHAIFSLHIETASKVISNARVLLSTVHLVDLGGIERLNKSQPSRHIADEAKHINKSLSFLEQVLLSLARPRQTYIPYRQCKLTQYLSDTLHIDSQIVFIANIRGEPEFIEETISTLKFASRVKGLCTDPISFHVFDEEKLSEKRQKEIDLLKQELTMQDMLHCGGTTGFDPLNEVQVNKIRKQVKEFVEGTLPELKISTVRQTKEAFVHLKSYISSVEKAHEQEAEVLKSKVDNLEAKVQAMQMDQIEVAKSTSKGSVKKSVSSTKPEETVKETATEDGLSISIGKAPGNVKGGLKASPRKFSITRISVAESQKKKSSVGSGSDGDGGSQRGSMVRASTPPPREDAFETFKNGRGKELVGVFLQNKAILSKKQKDIASIKKRLREMSGLLQEVQSEVDSHNKESGSIMNASITTTDGRLVLREHEYTNLIKLKQLRSEYKLCLATLEANRAEVPVCLEHLIHSRRRLLKEFELWFKTAFLGDIPETVSQRRLTKIKERDADFVSDRGVKDSPAVLSSTVFHKANQRAMKRAKTWKIPEKKSFLATV